MGYASIEEFRDTLPDDFDLFAEELGPDEERAGPVPVEVIDALAAGLRSAGWAVCPAGRRLAGSDVRVLLGTLALALALDPDHLAYAGQNDRLEAGVRRLSPDELPQGLAEPRGPVHLDQRPGATRVVGGQQHPQHDSDPRQDPRREDDRQQP